MAGIGFDNLIRVSVNANAYLGDSYDAARKSGDVGFAFLFDVLAVVGEGIWLNGSISTDPIPFPDSNPLAYLTYDLDRSFSVALTAEGRESVEQDVGSGYKLNIDYVMMYLADSPDVPAFAFGPNAFESAPPGAYALREGYMTEATGNQSHAEGYSTTASGDAAHSEGRGTVATGDWSHAEGQGTEAVSTYAHAEGYSTHARSTASHAEGYRSNAGGQYAHAEGYSSTASNTAAHAEGWGTTASKAYSHAQNLGTKAASDSQTALGKYNVEDANGDYALIIGNGTDDSNRSNALTVGWDGSVDAAGKATIGDGLEVSGGSTFNNAVAHYGSEYFYNGSVIYANAREIDYTETPTANKYIAPIRARDMNGYEIGHCEWGKMANGKFIHNFAGIRSPVNGTWSWKQCQMFVDSSGTVSYVIHTPDAFCEALHVGDVVNASKGATSVANGTYTDLTSFSLVAGTWIVSATFEFASNATNRRVAMLNTTPGGNGISLQWRATENGVSGAATRVKLVGILQPATTTSYYLTAWQNSGGALNVACACQAVRIK